MGFIDTGFEKIGLGATKNAVIDTLELSRTVNTSMVNTG